GPGFACGDRRSSHDCRSVDAVAAISAAQQDSADSPDGVCVPRARNNRGDVARLGRRATVVQMDVGRGASAVHAAQSVGAVLETAVRYSALLFDRSLSALPDTE